MLLTFRPRAIALFMPSSCCAVLCRLLIAGLLFLSLNRPSFCQSNTGTKPKIRTITAFVRLNHTNYRSQIANAKRMLLQAKTIFQSEGYEVQTIRISTQPFFEYTKGMSREEIVLFMRNIDDLAASGNFIVSIGPAMMEDDDRSPATEVLGEVLRNTRFLNASMVVAAEDGIHWKAINAAARLMKFLENNTDHSLGNFRFSAIALVPALTPFYPGSYHTGPGQQFTLGLQWANSVAAAFRSSPDLASAGNQLADTLNSQAQPIQALSRKIERDTGWAYMGIDLSPAPLGEESIGAAIEDLTKQPIGVSGTLSAAAIITGVLKDIAVKHAGYSGLMLPVLEDARLARRWGEGKMSLDGLLSYSAVCGTGLDVVPLPGDVSESQLARIVGDVASLSVKWHKPLSARLLPVAGKKAGDHTEFADPYLINTVIQPVGGQEEKP
jgi:uncharacterized protein